MLMVPKCVISGYIVFYSIQLRWKLYEVGKSFHECKLYAREVYIAKLKVLILSRLGQLQVGDRILSIEGIKVDGYSLQEAMKLVREADNIVEMEVMFEVQDNIPPSSGTFEVHMKKKTASLNLGITINGSHSRGDTIWISNLKKGGIAYRSGMLHSGDVLLAINGQSLENSNLREAAQILMNARESITLRIGKEATPPAMSSSQPIIFSVELHRNKQSLGITLKGSRDQAGHPVVISKIKEDGVAHKTGTLKVGDRILAINGESLYNKTMPEAVCMLNSAGDVVNLKISKATRRHQKSRHKSNSPTGRYRGHVMMRDYAAAGGFPVHHRESFGGSSSESSFVGAGLGGGGVVGHIPRSLYYRPRFSSFEPVLGESASGYNTPDNMSMVSSFPPAPLPPALYAGQLENRVGPAGATRNRLVMDHHSLTPTSEVSGSAFSQIGSVAVSPHAYYPHHQWPVPSQQTHIDDDQMSSVSSRSRRPYYNYSVAYPHLMESQLSSERQYVMRQQKSAGSLGARGVSKRDSSTDDEMSACDLEARVSTKYRRSSLPDNPTHLHQYSPQYQSRETHAGGNGGVWDFKSRRPFQKLLIPVGRVSPITPTETERLAVMTPPCPPQQQVKAPEEIQVCIIEVSLYLKFIYSLSGILPFTNSYTLLCYNMSK